LPSVATHKEKLPSGFLVGADENPAGGGFMGVDGCVIYSRVEERVKDNSRSFKVGSVQMRWVAFLCFFSFSTAALALDDCNAKFPNTSQLEDRLKCLQSNNNSLQSQLDALKAEMGGSSAKQTIAKPQGKPVAKPVAKPNKPHAITAQPLTRADCKKAGMQWNSNANVCGGR
jgi:hypothetical protein